MLFNEDEIANKQHTYLSKHYKSRKYVLNKWSWVPGFFDFPELYIDRILQAPINAKFVEIGIEYGKSTLFMTKMLSIFERHDISFTAIDNNPKLFPTLYRLFEKTELDKYIHLVLKNSVDAALDYEDNSLDFVFIDADHSYESIKSDVEAWYPKVKSGSILAGHDFHIKSFPYLVAYIHNRFKGNLQIEGSCWITRKE